MLLATFNHLDVTLHYSYPNLSKTTTTKTFSAHNYTLNRRSLKHAPSHSLTFKNQYLQIDRHPDKTLYQYCVVKTEKNTIYTEKRFFDSSVESLTSPVL